MIDTYFHNGSTNNNNYDSFDSYLEKYKGDKPNFKSIIWNNYDWLKEIDDSGYTTAENLTVKPNGIGIIVHELLFPIGAVVDIKIPTLPSFNRKCVVVGHNLTTNPNNIEILMNKTDAYNFGERAVQARFLHIADNSKILKILANEEEEEHDFT